MKPIGRAIIKKAEELEASIEKKADRISWLLAGALCTVGIGGFIYIFASILCAYFCG